MMGVRIYVGGGARLHLDAWDGDMNGHMVGAGVLSTVRSYCLLLPAAWMWIMWIAGLADVASSDLVASQIVFQH